MKRRVQCKACPWRKDVDPATDIPGGYCENRHANLKETIAQPGDFIRGAAKQMACHESMVGEEFVCVGWLNNQLGPGNNIAVRLGMMAGRFPQYELVGEQHERFEDTLPRRGARKPRRKS